MSEGVSRRVRLSVRGGAREEQAGGWGWGTGAGFGGGGGGGALTLVLLYFAAQNKSEWECERSASGTVSRNDTLPRTLLLRLSLTLHVGLVFHAHTVAHTHKKIRNFLDSRALQGSSAHNLKGTGEESFHPENPIPLN